MNNNFAVENVFWMERVLVRVFDNVYKHNVDEYCCRARERGWRGVKLTDMRIGSSASDLLLKAIATASCLSGPVKVIGPGCTMNPVLNLISDTVDLDEVKIVFDELEITVSGPVQFVSKAEALKKLKTSLLALYRLSFYNTDNNLLINNRVKVKKQKII